MSNLNVDDLLAGNRRALAKAITLVESSRLTDQTLADEIVERILPNTGKSIRVGISGSPGVGKSSFIESLGRYLISQQHKVAVLAVDPSSPVTGGSILADKTRMEELAREPNAYIRPSPSSGALGGVAHKTRETMLLCEAAGFDVVLIETVGVGQSEYRVADMVDFFAVLVQPFGGDELQGIKKGIIELADAVLVNKADGASLAPAEQTQRQYQNALHLLAHDPHWTPSVLTCSAHTNTGIDTFWQQVQRYQTNSTQSGYFQQQREQQNLLWLNHLFQEMITLKLSANASLNATRELLRQQVINGETTPLMAAKKLADLI